MLDGSTGRPTSVGSPIRSEGCGGSEALGTPTARGASPRSVDVTIGRSTVLRGRFIWLPGGGRVAEVKLDSTVCKDEELGLDVGVWAGGLGSLASGGDGRHPAEAVIAATKSRRSAAARTITRRPSLSSPVRLNRMSRQARYAWTRSVPARTPPTAAYNSNSELRRVFRPPTAIGFPSDHRTLKIRKGKSWISRG